MVKRCLFCGRYFKPDPRVGQNQKACFRDCCKRARKQLAQNDWFRRNPDYFRGRYWYVKQWRQRRKELAQRQMIQDERPVQKALSHPIYKLIFLIPGGLKRQMIQDEMDSGRDNSLCFVGRQRDGRDTPDTSQASLGGRGSEHEADRQEAAYVA